MIFLISREREKNEKCKTHKTYKYDLLSPKFESKPTTPSLSLSLPIMHPTNNSQKNDIVYNSCTFFFTQLEKDLFFFQKDFWIFQERIERDRERDLIKSDTTHYELIGDVVTR